LGLEEVACLFALEPSPLRLRGDPLILLFLYLLMNPAIILLLSTHTFFFDRLLRSALFCPLLATGLTRLQALLFMPRRYLRPLGLFLFSSLSVGFFLQRQFFLLREAHHFREFIFPRFLQHEPSLISHPTIHLPNSIRFYANLV
jgi:hypothetical protein